MSIEPHTNETQTQWDNGEFQVMVMSPSMSAPIGFCEGTPADYSEILQTAEMEGVEVVIEKKKRKTGREIWTIQTVAEL